MRCGVLLITLLCPLLINSLDILGILPHGGKSHYIVFNVFLRELANKGHNVTVISHFNESDAPNNLNTIQLEGGTIFQESALFNNFYYFLLVDCVTFLFKVGNDNCRLMLENRKVQDLIETKRKFDVIIVQQFNSDCALGIAHQFDAPVIGISSHVLLPWHYSRFGIPYNPSYVPFYFLGGNTPNLAQRVAITALDVYFNVMYYIMSQRPEQKILTEYFDNVPPLEDLGREIKLQLLCQNFVLTGPRLLPPNVIEVGGLSVTEAKPLKGDLQKFMDDAENGVILISFGSVLKLSALPTEKLEVIKGIIDELPQKFIWKWNDELYYENKKVYLSKWLPQIDILGHPNIVAFFSHGGMGSVTEAIHFGVPMVIMPIFADQPSNAAAVEDSGLGVKIEFDELTKYNLKSAFKKVLDKRFYKNVKELSRSWHDRPMSPLDTAVFWTEFVARYPKKTFRAPSATVPLYQYFLLDILLVFIVIIVLTVFLVSFFCCSKKKIIVKQKKK